MSRTTTLKKTTRCKIYIKHVFWKFPITLFLKGRWELFTINNRKINFQQQYLKGPLTYEKRIVSPDVYHTRWGCFHNVCINMLFARLHCTSTNSFGSCNLLNINKHVFLSRKIHTFNQWGSTQNFCKSVNRYWNKAMNALSPTKANRLTEKNNSENVIIL